MNNKVVSEYFQSLDSKAQDGLLKDLYAIRHGQHPSDLLLQRRDMLNNKQGECPHCGHSKYVKFGKERGAQRYKCKGCNRSFTEYSGTWMAGLHRKDKVPAYLELMMEEKSLDKITKELGINKKTAFDWRHKVLASIEDMEKGDFKGITESDETFFLHSQKGQKVKRKSRKRGERATKPGISDQRIAVITTLDRSDQIDLTMACKLGRIRKQDIETAIGERISKQTILCTDAHVSYYGFAADHRVEHYPMPGVLGRGRKNRSYHIQHVNATHNHLKKWINGHFWGVSTKYLQNYLNWFRLKKIIANEINQLPALISHSLKDNKAKQRFKYIPIKYKQLTT
jgi:transposase-like protein